MAGSSPFVGELGGDGPSVERKRPGAPPIRTKYGLYQRVRETADSVVYVYQKETVVFREPEMRTSVVVCNSNGY